jgi:hypothetical protein
MIEDKVREKDHAIIRNKENISLAKQKLIEIAKKVELKRTVLVVSATC